MPFFNLKGNNFLTTIKKSTKPIFGKKKGQSCFPKVKSFQEQKKKQKFFKKLLKITPIELDEKFFFFHLGFALEKVWEANLFDGGKGGQNYPEEIGKVIFKKKNFHWLLEKNFIKEKKKKDFPIFFKWGRGLKNKNSP